jgi:hypothetical protein
MRWFERREAPLSAACSNLYPALVSPREGWVPFAGTACIGVGARGLDRTFVEFAPAMVY